MAAHWFGDRDTPQETPGRYDSGTAVRQGYTEDPGETGFLSEGGWHIEKAGSTGLPVGRPPQGILDEDEMYAAINAGLDPERQARIDEILGGEGGRLRLSPSALRQIRAELVGGVVPVDRNTKTVGDFYGITPRSARTL